MKIQDIKNLNPEELRDKLKDLQKQLMELSFQRKTGNVEKPHLFRSIKRTIARILTVLKEKSDG